MSARYVWEKYKVLYTEEFEEVNSVDLTVLGADSSKLAKIGENVIESASYPGNFQFSGSTGYLAHGYFSSEDNFVAPTMSSVFPECYSAYYSGSAIKKYWYAENVRSVSGGMAYTLRLHATNSPDSATVHFAKKTLKASRGDIVSNVSSESKSKYPTTSGGAVSGNYWYIYQGEDNIDPLGIAYPMDNLRPGDKITISVSKSSSIKYGGTISYLYQYQLNGGSWTNIQTTSAESISFTVPSNAKTIRFRVRAQDDMGFVSTTYVTGDTAGVERLNLWIGVNGKARKGAELYVGVNGKARKVVATYIGVNGKARRFL